MSRNRRRYGGYIVHVGIVIYFVAFTGLAFQVKQQVELLPGRSRPTMRSPFGHTYQLTHLGVSQYTRLNRHVTAAHARSAVAMASASERSTSETRQYVDSFGEPTFEQSTEVGIRSDLREDLYVVYARFARRHRARALHADDQPAGELVLDRWRGADGRRADHDVAGRTADATPSASARSPQAGYAVPLAGVVE